MEIRAGAGLVRGSRFDFVEGRKQLVDDEVGSVDRAAGPDSENPRWLRSSRMTGGPAAGRGPTRLVMRTPWVYGRHPQPPTSCALLRDCLKEWNTHGKQ